MCFWSRNIRRRAVNSWHGRNPFVVFIFISPKVFLNVRCCQHHYGTARWLCDDDNFRLGKIALRLSSCRVESFDLTQFWVANLLEPIVWSAGSGEIGKVIRLDVKNWKFSCEMILSPNFPASVINWSSAAKQTQKLRIIKKPLKVDSSCSKKLQISLFTVFGITFHVFPDTSRSD